MRSWTGWAWTSASVAASSARGPASGGSCFPSQVRALPELMRASGVVRQTIGSVADSNDAQSAWVVDRLEQAMGTPVRDRCVTLLGLTFKADDDLRDSPAIRLAREVHRRGGRLAVHDPVALEAGVRVLEAQGIEVAAHRAAAAGCDGADAVIVATEWPEYRRLPWAAIAPRMRGRWVADTRQVVDRALAAEAGLVVLRHGLAGPARSEPVASIA